MPRSKIIYGDEVLIDLTGDTVTAETLAEGVTAHDKAGNAITGTMQAGGGGVETCTVNITFSWSSMKSGTMYRHLPDVDVITFKDGDTGELSGYVYPTAMSASSTRADTSVNFKVFSGDCFVIVHDPYMSLVLDENASGDSKEINMIDSSYTIICVTSDCSITLEQAGSSDGPTMPG